MTQVCRWGFGFPSGKEKNVHIFARILRHATKDIDISPEYTNIFGNRFGAKFNLTKKLLCGMKEGSAANKHDHGFSFFVFSFSFWAGMELHQMKELALVEVMLQVSIVMWTDNCSVWMIIVDQKT
jgi:hypothetical protein